MSLFAGRDLDAQTSVEKAVEFAAELARRLGANVARAEIVHNGSNLVVGLLPAMTVAKIARRRRPFRTSTEWFARELATAAHLNARGIAVTSPATTLPAGPHCYRGEIMSFWDHIPLTDEPKSPRRVGALLRVCHDGLAAHGLASSCDLMAEASDVLRATPASNFIAGERALLMTLVERVLDPIRTWSGPQQALHGDADLVNVLTSHGEYFWCDFEDAHVGSLLWDLACLIAPARVIADEAFCEEALDGYGRPPNPQELDVFVAARVLHQAVWSASFNNPGPSPSRLARLRWLDRLARRGRSL